MQAGRALWCGNQTHKNMVMGNGGMCLMAGVWLIEVDIIGEGRGKVDGEAASGLIWQEVIGSLESGERTRL